MESTPQTDRYMSKTLGLIQLMVSLGLLALCIVLALQVRELTAKNHFEYVSVEKLELKDRDGVLRGLFETEEDRTMLSLHPKNHRKSSILLSSDDHANLVLLDGEDGEGGARMMSIWPEDDNNVSIVTVGTKDKLKATLTAVDTTDGGEEAAFTVFRSPGKENKFIRMGSSTRKSVSPYLEMLSETGEESSQLLITMEGDLPAFQIHDADGNFIGFAKIVNREWKQTGSENK